jgi:hypothetical protein
MSIFQTLFGGFGTQQPAQQTQQVQQVPQNQNSPIPQANSGQGLPGTQTSPNTEVNGVVPAQGQTQHVDPNATQQQQSPLDPFKDLWKTPDTPKDQQQQGLFQGLDPAKIHETASKINFAQVMNPETLQKIAAGGEDASKAFQDSMNKVAQTVYGQSALATTKIVEQALAKQQEQFMAQLPQMFTKMSANNSLLQQNPILNNPAVQPLVGALQEQLLRKNPNATPQEIQTQVTDYLSSLGQVFAPQQQQSQQQQSNQSQDTDWSKYFAQ